MRNDLRIGDYVRTEDGLIAKYIGKDNDYKWHIFNGKIQWFFEYYREEIDYDDWEEFIKEEVVKTSDKLIDLIERNDIITLKNDNDVYKVLSVPDEKIGSDCFYLVFDYEKEFGVEDIRVSKEEMEENLCSIVTKEQFEQAKYEERENA